MLAAGRVAGTIAYAGPAVHAAKIPKTDAACVRELRDPTVTLSKSGKALANVLVRVVSAVTPAEAPSDPVAVTEHDCMYEPRVQGAVKGQRIVPNAFTFWLSPNDHASIGTRRAGYAQRGGRPR